MYIFYNHFFFFLSIYHLITLFVTQFLCSDDQEESKDSEEEFRSDLTADHHPKRTTEYSIEALINADSEVEENTLVTEPVEINWIVRHFNVSKPLSKFREASLAISPKKMSDLRLL
jgi:hypothetical protein